MNKTPYKLEDTLGRKFGKLTAIRLFKKEGSRARFIECSCDCGKICYITPPRLHSGNTRSCGCMKYKFIPTIRHGATRGNRPTLTYAIWASMRQRCKNPNNKSFDSYGGRGIKVCDRWNLFENFLVDMGDKSEGLSLDRIDVNGNYEPSNCRWATSEVQANNKRRRVSKSEYCSHCPHCKENLALSDS